MTEEAVEQVAGATETSIEAVLYKTPDNGTIQKKEWFGDAIAPAEPP
ncbi:hypothetical protein [Sphaerothrix gracilis]